MGDGGSIVLSIIYVFVSVASDFVHLSTTAAPVYNSFGEFGAFNVLLAAVKQEGFFVATGGRVGEVSDAKSFAISCDW